MPRGRLRTIVWWQCNEHGLWLNAPHGKVSAITLLALTHTQARYRVLGREHLFVRGAKYTKKQYLYSEPNITVHEYRGLWQFSHACINAVFAGFQPHWVPKDTYVYLAREPVKILRISADRLVVRWSEHDYTVYPRFTDQIIGDNVQPLPDDLWKTLHHLAPMLCGLIKSQPPTSKRVHQKKEHVSATQQLTFNF